MKHHFIVPAQMTNDLSPVETALTRSGLPTIVLSTEGLTNHLYDFPVAALREFRALTRRFEVTVFVVLRDPAKWARSNYKQSLTNPIMPDFGYGTSLRLEQWVDLERVRKQMNFERLKSDAAEWYGAHRLVTASFEENWAQQFADLLGIDDISTDLTNQNSAISDDLDEIVRQINEHSQDDAVGRETILSGLQICFNIEKPRLRILAEHAGLEAGQIAVRSVLPRLVAMSEGQANLINRLNEWSQSAYCKTAES